MIKTSQAKYFKCQVHLLGEESHERQTPQAENFLSDDVDDKNKHHQEITVKLNSHTNNKHRKPTISNVTSVERSILGPPRWRNT